MGALGQRSLQSRSIERVMQESAQTADVLREMPLRPIHGRHGTRMLAPVLPEKQPPGATLPKVYVEGRKMLPLAGHKDITRNDDRLQNEVAPHLFVAPLTGEQFRIRGIALASKNEHDWSVISLGGNRWRCQGGTLELRANLFTEQETEELRVIQVPDKEITLTKGWIVLRLTGAQCDESVRTSNFSATGGALLGVAAIRSDFDCTITDVDTGTSSASFGDYPVCWVAQAGEVEPAAVILPSANSVEYLGTEAPIVGRVDPWLFGFSREEDYTFWGI